MAEGTDPGNCGPVVRRRRRLRLLTVVATAGLAACGGTSDPVSPTQAISVATRYASLLFVHRDCTQLASFGHGVSAPPFDCTNVGLAFPPGTTVVGGPATYVPKCPNLVQGGPPAKNGCVTIRLVGHTPGRWSDGTLALSVARINVHSYIDGGAYAGGVCFGDHVTCREDASLWAKRLR